jgi:death on curing protein
MTELLTFNDALAVVDELGFVIRDVGLLSSALGRPGTTMFGEDVYVDLFTKAAALLHSVARNHALVDGNKRTAWTLTRVLMLLNGYEMYADPLDAVELVLAIVTEDLPLETVARWIKAHAVEV